MFEWIEDKTGSINLRFNTNYYSASDFLFDGFKLSRSKMILLDKSGNKILEIKLTPEIKKYLKLKKVLNCTFNIKNNIDIEYRKILKMM